MPNFLSIYRIKLSLFCLISIAILSLLPGNKLPETDIQYADLLVHVLMYAFLTIVVFWEFRQFQNLNLRYSLWIILVLIIYGAIMEILQENLIKGRFGSWSDFIANSFGCILALMFNLKLAKN